MNLSVKPSRFVKLSAIRFYIKTLSAISKGKLDRLIKKT